MKFIWFLSLLLLATVQEPPPPPNPPPAAATEEPLQGPLLAEPLRSLALSLRRAAAPPVDRTNRYADHPAAVQLGALLFSDRGLSGDGKSSCATCHRPDQQLVDGKTHPRGFNQIPRDTPTLHDVAGHRWWGWDGRWDSLWMQALSPIEEVDEMAGDRLLVLRHLAATPPLLQRYQQLFGSLPDLSALPEKAIKGGEPTAEWLALSQTRRRELNRAFTHIGKAIAAYERTLRGPSTPFDHYLEAVAKEDAVAAAEYPISARRGLQIFLGKAQCIRCHSGSMLSDGEFHDTGILTSGRTARDAGRYGGIQELRIHPFRSGGEYSDDSQGARAGRTERLQRDVAQWGAFRTPSLRYLVGTAPYFHDGGMADLRSVVRFYTWRQGARPTGAGHSHQGETMLTRISLTRQEEDDLIHFLESLSARESSPTPDD
ncbi:MAG: cytochrome-c peroxidase [Planctomycetota bacterium]|nr:cytochrome-c peroxidase [Planctomycetota bacterium]